MSAELLITQNELDQYLAGLDLSTALNNRVFNAIQLLTPTLYNNALYYLVIGKLTPERLDTVSINNASIKVLLDSLSGADESVLARKRVYEKFHDDLPLYRGFIKKMNQTSPQFFFRMQQPNTNFITSLTLDKTGLDTTKFTGLFETKTKYNQIIAKSRLSAEYTALATYAQAQGFSRLITLIENELNAFKLINVEGTNVQSAIPAETSILGYILRGVFTDPFRVHFIDNINYALMRMVDKYDQDTSRTGVVGLKAAWLTDTWEAVFLSQTSTEFIEKLGRTSYVRYVLPNIYGSVFFTPEEIAAESAAHSTIISGVETSNGVMDLAYKYLMKVVIAVRLGMTPLSIV
jgi:hypothetical protein